MGYTLRVPKWRYTVWVAFNSTTVSNDWNMPIHGEELYSHKDDFTTNKFDYYESISLVSTFPEVASKMKFFFIYFYFKQNNFFTNKNRKSLILILESHFNNHGQSRISKRIPSEELKILLIDIHNNY